jgi:hypothetical protein
VLALARAGATDQAVTRYDEADTYFTQAAAFNDRAHAKFFAACAKLSWWKLLVETTRTR